MATTLELIRGDVTLDISDEVNFVHESNDGFGMPPIRRLTERGPLQHGVSDKGYRLDPRVVSLVVPLLATWDTHFNRRATLLDILNPAFNQTIHLRFTLPDGSRRQLDCHANAGPLFSTQGQMAGGSSMRAGFSIVAHDPSWYDPTPRSVTFGIGGGGTSWDIPWAIPWTLGASDLSETYLLDYPGSWYAYPTIRITGPITNPVIVNNANGDKLDFTGFTIASGHYYEIDLRYGYKTILMDGTTNKISELSVDSDLATWAIQPGENSIAASGTSIDGATRIDITYQDRYIGV